MNSFLALDQGTTSSRAIFFSSSGEVLGQAQHEFAQHFPASGLVEHDAEEIFTSMWRAVEDARAAAGDPAVAAVGITNQRETVVVFDRASGKPIHRAIVWQDRRTHAELGRLAAAGHGEMVQRRTGLPLDPYFSAAKIAWILDHVQGARAAAERGELAAGTIDAWLLWKLTDGAVFATEPSNASRTSLFDLDAGGWDDELLELFRVPRCMLPEIRPSAGDFGEITATGWPIFGMLGDQQAALFGQACLQPGESKCTYGTGAFLLSNCGPKRPPPAPGLLSTVAWQIGNELCYALEGSVLVSGAAVQWLRDGLGMVSSAAEIETLARSVCDSAGLILVPAFAGLGTPHWDPQARGLLIGIDRGTERGHIARATLEAMAAQVREVQLAMEQAAGRRFTELRVDGGAAANDLLMEIQATLSDLTVRRPACLETTAFGAARIAMLGSGRFDRADQLPGLPGEPRCFAPGEALRDPAALWRRWQVAVDRSKGWASL